MMETLDITTLPLTGTVCIEASAGTGKTFTIGLIALRLVMEEPGIDLAKLAVVTFTDTATGELSGRIGEFLRTARDYAASGVRAHGSEEIYALVDTAAAQGKNTVIRRLDDALLNFDLARISTIHGFCSRILNEFAFETRSSFGMELLKNTDDVIDQILADFWRKEIAPLDPRLFQFVEDVTPEALHEEFKGLMSFPGIEVKGPSVTEKEMLACFAAFAALGPLWKKSREDVLVLLNHPHRFKTKVYEPTPENLAAFASMLDACFENSIVDMDTVALVSFDALDGQIYAGERAGFTLPTLPIFVQAQEFIGQYGTYPDSFAASLKKRAYARLTVELKRRLAALRARSFNNMISDLADSLRGETGDVASLMRPKFSAVLVDEFQDTDALQYTIFHTLFFGREDVFFAMIGDPKQAIYRFRGGDINTYVRARSEVTAERRFTLANNFRSERRLIEAINGLYAIDNPGFNNTGPFLTPEIGYISVNPKRDIPSPVKGGRVVAPVTLWNVADGESPNERVIGKRIAKTITDLMDPDEPLIIGHENERLRLSDIAILVSSHHSAGLFKKILAQCGIRSVIAKSGSVFQSREADELILLMEAILNPSKEKTVRALLASGLYGYDLDALTEWEGDDARRLETLDELHDAKNRWTREGIAPAINHILNTAGVFTLSDDAAEELTQERRITNFRHLIEILHIEDLSVGKVPERLLSAFIRMKTETDESTGGDEKEQRLESDYDAVQIFTMHKAKGLQWPVVFAPELYKDGTRKSSAPIYYENGYRKADLHPEMHDKIREEVKVEIRQESMRVAYVTLTRAESLLYAITTNKPTGKGKTIKADMTPAALLLRSPELARLRDGIGNLFDIQDLQAPVEPVLLKTLPTVSKVRRITDWGTQRELKASWSVGSYSGLIRGISHERRHTDPDAVPAEGIFAFPMGPDAGTALHSVFERIDFMDVVRLEDTSRTEIDRMIEGVLTDNGISPGKHPENTVRVFEMVKKVMQSEIPGVAPGFRLGDLQGEDRLVELEFHLTAGHPDRKDRPVTAEDLKTAVGPAIARIPPGRKLNGYLTGFIDLVFRHTGKWYILDWKSNHLGNSANRYNHDAMEQVMIDHNYHLQYHIYTVALTRYLAAATGGTFNYESDFGGVLYVFLRGVDGTGNGVYVTRPNANVISSLEAVL